MLFREIISIYYENNMKPINLLCGWYSELLTIKTNVNDFKWSIFQIKSYKTKLLTLDL